MKQLVKTTILDSEVQITDPFHTPNRKCHSPKTEWWFLSLKIKLFVKEPFPRMAKCLHFFQTK